jgi:GAF domain-containing protein
MSSRTLNEAVSKCFDDLIAHTRTGSLNGAFYAYLPSFFEAEEMLTWFYDSHTDQLFCPSTVCAISVDQGIVGYTFSQPKVTAVARPSEDPHYRDVVDKGEFPSLYIPLTDPESRSLGILQLWRSPDAPFLVSDTDLATVFAARFSRYSHLLLPDVSVGSSCLAYAQPAIRVTEILALIQKHFRCPGVDLWTRDQSAFWKFQPAVERFMPTREVSEPIKVALLNTLPSNVAVHCQYFEAIDPDTARPMVIQTFSYSKRSIAVVFREKRKFSHADHRQFAAFLPIITKPIGAFADGDDLLDTSVGARLQALVDVAQILGGVLEIDALIPLVLERAGALLECERCSLFLVDKARKELITSFAGGLDRPIRLPLKFGLVGHCAATGEILNISDAYSDPRFNSSVDRDSGFKTRTILAGPIVDHRGEILGVTEMMNRRDGKPFNDEDVKMMLAFDVFCGIAFDNARLYQVSLDLTKQLRNFLEVSSALNQVDAAHDVLIRILDGTRNIISASRATVFISEDPESPLKTAASIGDPVQYGAVFAEIIAKDPQTRVFREEEIKVIIEGGDLEEVPPEPIETQRDTVRVSSVVETGPLESYNRPDSPSICCIPLLGAEAKVLGVLELETCLRVSREDLKLLECFGAFAAVSLEKTELQEIAQLGHAEVRLKQFVGEDERHLVGTIPAKLTIPLGEGATVFQIGFDAQAWDGIGHFKVLWAIFSRFDMLTEFKISNEKFFRFVDEISGTYNQVPYHNWRHAVDVTQFISYEVSTAHLAYILTKFDLFALLVGAICHDANHDGFSNSYNVQAQTPLGILFKNQSVMETHHCEVAIHVISDPERNIFESLSPVQTKEIWNTIITLILGTDMAKHFTFLKEVNARLDAGPLNETDPEDRLMMMQLVLHCADISNVSRPFELANKWCDVLCEEFFRQGDLEKTQGMEYSSPLNDREHLDKAKSQIGFYQFVCLPLYETASRAIPLLEVNVGQIKSNLAVWKDAAEGKPQKGRPRPKPLPLDVSQPDEE